MPSMDIVSKFDIQEVDNAVNITAREVMTRYDLKDQNVEVHFNNMNATDADKRKEVINELKSFGDIRVKILMHSLAFGTLRPLIDDEVKNTIQQKQIEMTLDVMANSIIYWSQDLFQSGLIKKGSQIFAMTSSGGHRQWKAYGAVSAAKACLESYCRQLAFELCEHGIAINAIQAGVTDTPSISGACPAAGKEGQRYRTNNMFSPLRTSWSWHPLPFQCSVSAEQ